MQLTNEMIQFLVLLSLGIWHYVEKISIHVSVGLPIREVSILP